MQPLEYSGVDTFDDEDGGGGSRSRRTRYAYPKNSGVNATPLLIFAMFAMVATLVVYSQYGRASSHGDDSLDTSLADIGAETGDHMIGSDSASVDFTDSEDTSYSQDDGDAPLPEDTWDSSAKGSRNSSTGLIPTCDEIDCETHFLSNGVPMYPGHALCNQNHRFGLTRDGSLMWHDCDTLDVSGVMYNRTQHMLQHPQLAAKMAKYPRDLMYWILHPNATLEVGQYHSESRTKSTVLWQRDTTREGMHFTKACLRQPVKVDCPYFRLRSRGELVMNWQDADSGKWMDRQIERCYSDLFVPPE